MPSVLVTGATGGLGRVLIAALRAQGRTVLASGRNPAIGAELAGDGVRFVAADLVRDDLRPLLDGVGSVFHLAALSSPWGAEQRFIDINLKATQRLLAAAQASGCRRFIFTSTPSIYTRARHQYALTEDSPLPSRLINAYARTKYAAERQVRGAARPDFATVSLRPRAILGPHDSALLPRLLRAAQRGVMPLPGFGRALIEPTDARDVASALLLAEARAEALSGQVFNLGGGQGVPLAELAQAVFQRLGRPVRTLGLPAPLVLGLATLLETQARLRPNAPEPLLTRYGAMVLGWSQTFDLSAARQQLGWQPTFNVQQSLDWALEHHAHA
ncbi:MAG: 2-alkyl-3-oxoalkanoate reductase [Stenotrophomonas maltophilia]|nr:MAG: 2-alkyl-3-oxoalkanoate reductase [Stenotrophomonas maltophilia]